MAEYVQDLNFVVRFDGSALLTVYDQVFGPGTRIADPSTNNFPDGPGPLGPGGGPEAPSAPPMSPGFNDRNPGRNVRDKGSGIQPHRGTGTPFSPPPSPPPPATLTRTYTPFVAVHDTEHVGVFAIGPKDIPLTPPTDLEGQTHAIDFFGSAWNIIELLNVWNGVTLPTVAEINQLFVLAGWVDAGLPAGPYESSADT